MWDKEKHLQCYIRLKKKERKHRRQAVGPANLTIVLLVSWDFVLSVFMTRFHCIWVLYIPSLVILIHASCLLVSVITKHENSLHSLWWKIHKMVVQRKPLSSPPSASSSALYPQSVRTTVIYKSSVVVLNFYLVSWSFLSFLLWITCPWWRLA